MIQTFSDGYLLSTKSTSYAIFIAENGKAVSAYYGPKIPAQLPSLLASCPSNVGPVAPGSFCSEERQACEFSLPLRGDYHIPSIILETEDSSVFDFRFQKGEIRVPNALCDLPTPHGASEELVLTFVCQFLGIVMELHYLVFEESDVIARNVVIRNHTEKELHIQKAMSYQLAFANHDDILLSNYGSWAHEAIREEIPLPHARVSFGSINGWTSNRHNSFFAVKEKSTSKTDGNIYGFHLLWSGNYEISIERDSFDMLRIQGGIDSTLFDKALKKGKSFETPWGILAYSAKGEQGLSLLFQHFVKEHILPPLAREKTQPIVYNNFDATGFTFDENKVHSLMDKASDLGIETFVLDDGWFEGRKDDRHALGDWIEDKKRLPHGLKGLADYSASRGMSFGIWMEPEMVCEDSHLYQEHPDWIVRDPSLTPYQAHGEWTLDLRKKEVQDDVIATIERVLSVSNATFLKWDCNRALSDAPLTTKNGSFYYDYIVGLYRVLGHIRKNHPNLWMEACASGGNRFDLGVLSYFTSCWLSDDTDFYERSLIQSSLSLGYPISAFSNHVTLHRSNIMHRYGTLDSRYDVAFFGLLGYELDFDKLTTQEYQTIKEQIRDYKQQRHLIKDGDFYLIEAFDPSNDSTFEVTNGKEAVVSKLIRLINPTPAERRLRLKGLEEDALYSYRNRQERLTEEGKENEALLSEIDEGEAYGASFLSIGVPLAKQWNADSATGKEAYLSDFSGRLYFLKKKE